MNDPLNVNPPAIVREAQPYSLKDLARKIRPLLRKQADNAIDIGEQMELLFARVTGSARAAFLRKEFGFGERQAWKYLRAYRKRAETREKQPELECAVDSLSPSLAAAMRILEEDAPTEDVASNGEVPFQQPESAPKPAQEDTQEPPEREPGDDTEYEDTAAKIEKALCDRCKRMGAPSCDRCRVKAFNIQNNVQPKPPAAPRKATSNNGQLVFDWGDWRGHFGHCVRSIDKLAGVTGTIIVNPELEGLRRLLDDWQKEFRKTYEKLTGQKPPRIEF